MTQKALQMLLCMRRLQHRWQTQAGTVHPLDGAGHPLNGAKYPLDGAGYPLDDAGYPLDGAAAFGEVCKTC